MNPADLLELAPKAFDDLREINTYSPLKIKDRYGYQYLIKGEVKSIRGSIHREKELSSEVFGRFLGEGLILSTKSVLNLGDLIEWDNGLWAIERETSFNKVMDLHHYIIKSCFDYYKEFIIDAQEQEERVLGANSMRYILSTESEIPLIPSLFEPTADKYITASIVNTLPISFGKRNEQGFITQDKKDNVRFLAVGLDTYELQEFMFALRDIEALGLMGNFPSWKSEDRYNKEFDLKANIHSLDCEFYYNITTEKNAKKDKLIEKIAWTLNPI